MRGVREASVALGARAWCWGGAHVNLRLVLTGARRAFSCCPEVASAKTLSLWWGTRPMPLCFHRAKSWTSGLT